MKHNEEKIRLIVSEIANHFMDYAIDLNGDLFLANKYDDGDSDAKKTLEGFIRSAMKEYAEYVREQTIEECIECLPKERFFMKHHMYAPDTERDKTYANAGFQQCREQTLNKLQAIKNLAPNK